MFKNKYADSRGRSFGSESAGRSGQPFVGNESGNRFSDDLELKVNSGDVGRIIGMYTII